MKKLRWGILGTATIAHNRIIPAIRDSEANEVVAVASRDLARARDFAIDWDIPTAYGSYDELLADPAVDAVYNPLPNHLHVPLSIQALEAGKHVLCEKPIALDAAEAMQLVRAAEQHPNLIAMEAFMYRFHPQWKKIRAMVEKHTLGAMRTVHSQFTYGKTDSSNIRNRPEWGGGGLMDIGTYCISASRLLFDAEPVRVCARLTMHPEHGVDVVASGILQFEEGEATFSCATEAEPSQWVMAVGERGSVMVENPFLLPDEDNPCRITVSHQAVADTLEFYDSDHYMDMFDAFAQAVINGSPAPTPLTDAVANMKVIDAVFASAKEGRWVEIERESRR